MQFRDTTQMTAKKALVAWELNESGQPVTCISIRDVLQNVLALARVGDGKVMVGLKVEA
jgi:hypothetical protein